ncbi:hypothetical protein [Clostridium beijerinckii]|uniref:hypothetical protein n=1 Tax=Clostridium beijerinckii TaxID=1520 RepID=UPI0024318DB4|nr:hypothetical protein [Clostridium beijerinckii]MDG5857068.1 hypothetical protein [Clostridium beijerinckii]
MWANFLNFINANSALWSFLATLATVVYVFFTYKLLKETIHSREIQNQPYVIVDLEIQSFCLKIIVKNVGNSPAKNIQINMMPNTSNPFSYVEFLAPNREISSVVSYVFRETELKETKYKFSISYNDVYKKTNTYTHEYTIDISPFLQSANSNENYNKSIVENLDKMLSKFDNLKSELHDISNANKNQADHLKDIKNKFR